MKQLDELNKSPFARSPLTPDQNDVIKEILHDLENDYNIWLIKVDLWKSSQHENK